MGLDSYLLAKRPLDGSEDKNNATIVTAVFPELSAVGVSASRVEAELGYWRSNRALHRWFVENVQGGRDECQRSYVSREQLQELLAIVERVLANPELDSELLPTGAGFFFGSTEYDEYYIQDLQETKKILDDVLNDPIFDGWDFYYQASW